MAVDAGLSGIGGIFIDGNVTALARGDWVLGYVTFGAARERIAAAADDLVKLAAGFSNPLTN